MTIRLRAPLVLTFDATPVVEHDPEHPFQWFEDYFPTTHAFGRVVEWIPMVAYKRTMGPTRHTFFSLS
jgi:hypothetical protein